MKRASAQRFAADFKHFLVLTEKVINQTRRRVIDEERVPAEEKVVSIFEEHTDIIRKDRRETLYGHKVCLTGGSSSMILDCVILHGNPADSTLAETITDRQIEIYGQARARWLTMARFLLWQTWKPLKARESKMLLLPKLTSQ